MTASRYCENTLCAMNVSIPSSPIDTVDLVVGAGSQRLKAQAGYVAGGVGEEVAGDLGLDEQVVRKVVVKGLDHPVAVAKTVGAGAVVESAELAVGVAGQV